MKKIKKFILQHKVITGIILIAVCYGGYFMYQKNNTAGETIKYITTQAKKGILISSITGSGQVSASNQVDIKPKVSGDIIEVNVKIGQEVKEGDLLTKIDTKTAARNLNDANANLATARLELDELLSPPDKLSLLQSENSVASAKNSLEELLAGADEASIKQAENSLIDAKDNLAKLKISQANNYQGAIDSKEQAEDNLSKAYEDAYNDISNVFLSLPEIKTSIYAILYSYEISEREISLSRGTNDAALINSITDYGDQNNFRIYLNKAKEDYAKVDAVYDNNFLDYKNTSRYSSKKEIENLLEETIDTVKKFADNIKSETNMLGVWVDWRTNNNFSIFTNVSSYQTNLKSYTSETNSHLSNLLSARDAITNYKDAIEEAERNLEEMAHNQPLELASSERTVQEKEDNLKDLKDGADEADIEAAKRSLAEKEASLANLKAGATELEIRNKKIAIQQKTNTVIDAKQTYDDHFIRAPFNGVIAEVNVSKGDSASSGGAIAVLMTNQKIAEITLNEIDAAKVKVGQKVNLNFDAINDLSIIGNVAEIDTIGTINQGVVSYNVKIAFTMQDERVKPGMSVSASIITQSKPDVLLVPITAVKKSSNSSFVEILVDNTPQNKTITTGLSNDTMIEITDGLIENEEVITQTIKSGTSTTAVSSNNPSTNRQSGSNPAAMGGMMRMMR